MAVPSFCRGQKVFVTGHTSFMSGWLSSCHMRHGAEVTGYSLETAVARTVEWYKAYYENGDPWAVAQTQCAEIMEGER